MKISPELAHALAAEYVLGTLRGRARKRFEAIQRADPEVAAIVRLWEDGLTPLAGRVVPIEPPARVWKTIEARTSPAKREPALRVAPWGPAASVGFWRAFGMVSAGLASVLFAFFLFISSGPRGEPMFVAVLTAPDSVPRMVVSMHSPDVLRVRMVKPWGGAAMEGKALELWVIPKQGAPRSLGMVVNAMGDTLIKVAAADPRVQDANALAVSMEPPGGSPTKQPTGPVLCSGMIAPVKRA